MATQFPLSWPDSIPRSKAREAGRFKTTLSAALANVRDSIRLFGVDSGRAVTEMVISSNVTLGVSNPSDPGVAIWFKWDGLNVCIPVDRYQTVSANLQAIHHIVEARRVELRHGTLALVRASMQGFKALPPSDRPRPWRDVMAPADGLQTREEIEARYRALARLRHPDRGGSDAMMAELNAARDAALEELSK